MSIAMVGFGAGCVIGFLFGVVVTLWVTLPKTRELK